MRLPCINQGKAYYGFSKFPLESRKINIIRFAGRFADQKKVLPLRVN
jgi:hypothetical protein